jgi:hypothetical protein
VLGGSTTYTISATFHVMGSLPEVGIIFGAAPGIPGQYLFSTVFGGGCGPWIGQFPPNYNPAFLTQGAACAPPPGNPPYDLELSVQVAGQMITGQMTFLTSPPKQLPAVQWTAAQPFVGSHIGFYTYGLGSVSLTSLTVN